MHVSLRRVRAILSAAALVLLALLAVPAPATAELSIVPSSWSRERAEAMWTAFSPPDSEGNQVAMVVPYVLAYSGDFRQWAEAHVPAIMQQIVGPQTARGPFIQGLRVKDPGGPYMYGPKNALGFWQSYDDGANGLTAWIWAYPTSKGAQILAIVFNNGMQQSQVVLETATGVSSYADFGRAIDAREAAPDSAYACDNPKTKVFTPFSYTKTECDYQGRNCRQVPVNIESHVTVCD